MKCLFIFLLCLPFLTFSQSKDLTYIESSSGLDYPDWEGGDSELEFADMNGDGFIDIISVGDHGCPYINTAQHGIMVWFNDGTGAWSVQMTGDLGYGGIAVGDVNNDGHWDVGYGIHHNYSSSDLGDQILEVALGDGSGTNWTAWDDGLATNGEDWGMFGTDFADIDNDGDLDIGSVSFGCCAGVHVYANQMDGSWIQSFGFLNGNAADRFVFGDINNDGNADFIVAHQYGAVYFGDGTGNFINGDGNLPNPGSIGFYGPSLGDIDNDGDKDIAFIQNAIEVWGWDQDNDIWTDLSGNLPPGGDFQETQLYDMNSDGYMDLAAYGDGIFKLWLGDGTGNWTEETQFTTTNISSCQAFRVGGDVDHNGYADIVLVAEGGSWPSYQNHLKCYKEASDADDLWIRGLFPKGNEVYIQNSVQFIEWASEVPEGDNSLVNIEFSFYGNSGPWSPVAENLANSGRFQWTIPNTGSTDCYLKFTVTTPGESSEYIMSSPFTIIGDEVFFADFIADTTTGGPPLSVNFTDLSSGLINLWIWDFNGDGIFDSYNQNPTFVYDEFGSYDVSLIISDGANADTMTKENYINILVTEIKDININDKPGLNVFPNPFTNDVSIYFHLYTEEDVSICIYDMKGTLVNKILDKSNLQPGKHIIGWNGKNSYGELTNAGVYYCGLKTNKTSVEPFKIIRLTE